jgi:ATP-dependent RNA helicase RhlE
MSSVRSNSPANVVPSEVAASVSDTASAPAIREFDSFDDMGIPDLVLRGVYAFGFEKPSPIQKKAIVPMIQGRDILAQAQSGTGKTGTFVIGGICQIDSSKNEVQMVVISPTRELAEQTSSVARGIGIHAKIRVHTATGGPPVSEDLAILQQSSMRPPHVPHVLAVTPGRFYDLLNRKAISPSTIRILVLDEADRMLDMGFLRDIKKILAALPQQRQNLLFSATFSTEIKSLADGLLNSPALIEVARSNSTNDAIAQKIHPVDRTAKHPLLAHLIKSNHWEQVLVFTRTKHGANKLVTQLEKDGITCMAIHGNKSQSARTKALADFKAGKLTALIATDIAARGIDIDQLPHVVNYDLPNVPEDYVHRIGRTGRAGSNGVAVSLVCVDEHQMLRDIERLIKQTLPQEVIAGFEPDPHAKPQPIQLRSGQGQGQGQRQGRGQGQTSKKQAGNAPRPGNAPRRPQSRPARKAS